MPIAAGPSRHASHRALALAIAAALSALAASVQAQPITGHAPWCVVVPFHGGNRDCSYYTLEQCMESARGVSNQCERNPWYVPEPGEGARKRR
jgi:hypothetical protein